MFHFCKVLKRSGFLAFTNKKVYGKPSYHIMQQCVPIIGNKEWWFFIWPEVYLSKNYCHNIKKAEVEFDKMVKENPKNKYRLVEYKSVTVGWSQRVIGLYDEPKVLKKGT